MTKDVHNNHSMRPDGTVVHTVGDLYAFVSSSDLPASKKGPIRSAIKRADELVGHGALDVPANAALIMKRLDAWSPAMADMSDGAFANMKSRLRAAFRLAKPHITHPRSRPRLVGEWRVLQDRLDVGPQRALSRLFHYVAACDLNPGAVDDAVLAQFADHIRDEAMVSNWAAVMSATIRAWNRLAQERPAGELQALTTPAAKRTPYWIAAEHWSSGLRSDVETLIDHLSKPNLFRGSKVRKIKPATVEQYRHMITTLVSATVGGGVRLADLHHLADAVHPDHVETALGFLAERGGGSVTPTMIQMMTRIMIIAEIIELRPEQRAELAAMCANLQAESDRPRRDMAPKNRALLDRLEEDQRFADLIQTLPTRLAANAREHKLRADRAASLMRTALAIDILLTCSVRRKNLVSLELGKSIRRIGKAPHQRWIIELQNVEVKNEEPLRFELMEPVAELLEEYLKEWRGKLCAQPSDWLFPAANGGKMEARSLADAIRRNAARILGTPLTPHQFRHISAESFLLENPDKLHLMSEHLGHRDVNTTRIYYARRKQKQASRVYHEHVLKDRKAAETRLAGGHRKTPRPPKGGDK